MRTPDELLASALAVIDESLRLSRHIKFFSTMLPLFSGGYDSLCACYVASQHPKFQGRVYHIDTGIGAKATRKYVNETCEELDWNLVVMKSRDTYTQFVATMGFPGPGAHQWVYIRLKERCVEQMTKGKRYYILVTGCRSEESTRRMGHVEKIKWGETSKNTGKTENENRIWIAPCHDWTSEEQRSFLNYHRFPLNPIKESPLAMSGECFCGAFARPGELDMIKKFAPDVAKEIARLEVVAKDAGISEKNRKWGYRREGRKPIEVVETGPMCSSCDRKARAAGVVFKETSCGVSNGKDEGQGETGG